MYAGWRRLLLWTRFSRMKHLLILLFWVLCHVPAISNAVFLPSVLWYPKNPLFSCPDPTINVQLDDKVNFVCPHVKVTADQSANEKYYENLYFLNDEEERFSSCNATNLPIHYRFLRCDNPSELKEFDSTHELNIRASKTGPTTITFEEGKTYYLIGTGFRTVDNLDDEEGGSCNTTSSADEYRLRLKLRVCSSAEVQSGNCTICKTEGCYYQDCGVTCSNWTAGSQVYRTDSNLCIRLLTRTCTNQLLGSSNVEQKEESVRCDKGVNCTEWHLNTAVFQSGGACFQFKERTCDNLIIGGSYTEKEQVAVVCAAVNCSDWRLQDELLRNMTGSCFSHKYRLCLIDGNWKVSDMSMVEVLCPSQPPTTRMTSSAPVTSSTVTVVFPSTPPSGAPQSGTNDDDADTYKYIAIGATIACFLVGIMLGMLCHRTHHRRGCPNRMQIDPGSHQDVVPFDNQGYRRSYNDEEYVDGTKKPPLVSMNGGIHFPDKTSANGSVNSTDSPLTTHEDKPIYTPSDKGKGNE